MSTKLADRKVTSADKMSVKVASMSRSQLKWALLSLQTRFRMDFTEEFLESLSKDRLRHILLAALLKAQ